LRGALESTRSSFAWHALDGGRRVGKAQPARGEQPERERLRLVLGEHHRRQLEPGHQSIAAVAPLLGGDGDSHLLQRRDVAAQRAPVDFQPARELRAAQLRVRLQELEDREDARGGL
jgi:hypothetical protein